MIGSAFHQNPALPPESSLREALAGGDAILAASVPVLRHLLGPADPTMFCDAAIAQIRGMIRNLAGHLLAARAEASDMRDPDAFIAQGEDRLAQLLAADDALLSYAHSLALETVLAERLQSATALDPVVSPLLQDLIAAGDEEGAGLAMEALAAQARFLQQQQRMELPPRELPDAQFLKALLAMRAHAGADDLDAQRAETVLREQRRAHPGRLVLIEDLLTETHLQAASRLSAAHAGLAVCLSALALASGQNRSTLVLSIFARGSLRSALAMRAAGLEAEQVERQLAMLGADPFAGDDLAAMSPQQAAMLLSGSAAVAG